MLTWMRTRLPYTTSQNGPKNRFYANFPSVSDTSMAPKGKEACFLLLPLAPGLEDTPAWREKYFHIMMDRMEHLLGQP